MSREKSKWDRLFRRGEVHRPETVSGMIRVTLDRDWQKARDRATKKAERDEKKAEERQELQDLLAHRRKINEALDKLKTDYDTTPAGKAMNLLQYKVSHFTPKDDDEHPNSFKREDIEDEKEGKWVGERIFWQWHNFAEHYEVHVHGDPTVAAIGDTIKKMIRENRQGKFSIKREKVVVSQAVGNIIELRFYGDRIEVIGSQVASLPLNGQPAKDILKELDKMLATAIVSSRQADIHNG